MKHFWGTLLLTLCLLFAGTPLDAASGPDVEGPPAQLSNDEVLDRIAEIKATVQPERSTFNDADKGWDTDGDEDVQRFYGPGIYQIRVDADNMMGWGSSPAAAGDFYAEVDVYHVDGPLDNEFGILFRGDGDNYYVYNVSSDGYYRLHKWLDEEWASVVDWAESAAIETGEGSHNRLGLLVEGPNISLLINDVVLATVTDDSISGDELALTAGSFDEGGVEVAFDDFTVWTTTDAAVTVATPVPTEPAQDTLDPELVATVIEPIRENAPDYSDDFRRASERWAIFENDNGAVAFANRGLNIGIDVPGKALWSTGQEIAELRPADMLVEADVVREAGADDATYGLLVRFVDNDNYYYFGISGEGTYSFWRVVAGEWTKLIDWTKTDTLDTETGAVNRLGVLAQGPQFVLLANDTALAEASDATFPAGGVGVYAGAYAEAGLDVTFDNLDVWVLSEGEATIPVDTEALEAAQARATDVLAGDVTYETRFAKDDGAWSLSESDEARTAIEDGGLQFEVYAEQWLAWAANDAEATDFLIEADIAMLDPDKASESGIVFRMQDNDNFYFMAIDNTGRFSLWKKESGEWHSLVPWAKTDALDTAADAANRVGVLAEGSQLSAMINGQVVATLEDTTFESGNLAMAVGTFATPDVSATFDNLSLWNMDQ